MTSDSGAAQGRTFGSYTLLHEIGRGGGSRVFAARQAGLDRRVAIKVLTLAGAGGSESALLRGRQEAQLLARLAHPGIVRVLDAGTEAGVPYLVMDLVDGCSLATVLARLRAEGGRATPTQVRAAVLAGAAACGASALPSTIGGAAARWNLPEHTAAMMIALAVEVADALSFAHAAGIVHRDVKPANVLWACDGRVLLADFGIAQPAGADGTVTWAGSPSHMAPEQARGERGDHRSDQYSLAATLFEALALRPPFVGGSPAELVSRVLLEHTPDVRRFAPQLGADIAAVLAKALSRDPARRYASIGEFAGDLRAVLAGDPTQARPRGRLVRGVDWLRRKPWRLGAVALAAGAVLALWFLDRQHRAALVGARDEANVALARLHRLGLGVRLERVRERSTSLLGIDPATIPEIERWLRDDAEPLVAALPELERTLAALREQALPLSAAQVAADRARIGHDEPMRQADREIEYREQALRRGDGDQAEHQARLEAMLEVRSELAKRLAANRSWQLPTDEQQFLHDQLARLVTDLANFSRGPSSRVERLRARIAATTTFHRRSVVEGADRWQAAAAAIAADARFAGLQLQPRCDLLPLRADPNSGLFEFVHLPSGADGREVPSIGADGRYELTDDTGMLLVLLPGGSFTMGAQQQDPDGPNHDPDALASEAPLLTVSLEPFYCGKYELTQAQLLRLAGPGGESIVRAADADRASRSTAPLRPATSISHRQLEALIRPFGLALPTEARWEYACRAGTATPFHFGARAAAGRFANVADEAAKRAGARWSCEPGIDDGHAGLAPIGAFEANAFGLHDMHGNVAEMVGDAAGRYQLAAEPGDGRLHAAWGEDWVVFRGGTYAHNLRHARSGGRALHESQDAKLPTTGARLVLPLQP